MDVACHVAEDLFKALGPRLVPSQMKLCEEINYLNNFLKSRFI